MRVMALEIIYQLLLVTGCLSAFVWLATGLDPNSPWLVGMICIPVSLLLTSVNYFIKDRIYAIKLKKYRRNDPLLFFSDSKPFHYDLKDQPR